MKPGGLLREEGVENPLLKNSFQGGVPPPRPWNIFGGVPPQQNIFVGERTPPSGAFRYLGRGGLIRPFKGRIRLFKSLIRLLKSLIRSFKGLIRPFKGLIRPLKGLIRPELSL